MKSYSKAAKRANKKAAREEFALAETPKRGKDKCFVDRTRQQRESEPRKTVLSARCRQAGREDTKSERNAMLYPFYSDPAGIAISIHFKDDGDRLKHWQTFCSLDGAEEVYHRRILSRSRRAKCGKVEYYPERFEARPEETTDTRDDDQKDRDASNRWAMWRGYVGHLTAKEQNALYCGVYLRAELFRDAALTPAGKGFVVALERLTDIAHDGRKRYNKP